MWYLLIHNYPIIWYNYVRHHFGNCEAESFQSSYRQPLLRRTIQLTIRNHLLLYLTGLEALRYQSSVRTELQFSFRNHGIASHPVPQSMSFFRYAARPAWAVPRLSSIVRSATSMQARTFHVSPLRLEAQPSAPPKKPVGVFRGG